jgi:hypothetical protein
MKAKTFYGVSPVHPYIASQAVVGLTADAKKRKHLDLYSLLSITKGLVFLISEHDF